MRGFQIVQLEIDMAGEYSFWVNIRFIVPPGEEKSFGILGEKYLAQIKSDCGLDYYSVYPNSLEDELHETGDGKTSRWISEYATEYELGLVKNVEVEGADKIYIEDDVYIYEEFISDSIVTRAVVLQLAIMKEEMYNNPDDIEAGCFRSGDSFHDFLGLLETLDRFWD